MKILQGSTVVYHSVETLLTLQRMLNVKPSGSQSFRPQWNIEFEILWEKRILKGSNAPVRW